MVKKYITTFFFARSCAKKSRFFFAHRPYSTLHNVASEKWLFQIHVESPRKDDPFIAFNCSSVTPNLLREHMEDILTTSRMPPASSATWEVLASPELRLPRKRPRAEQPDGTRMRPEHRRLRRTHPPAPCTQCRICSPGQSRSPRQSEGVHPPSRQVRLWKNAATISPGPPRRWEAPEKL